MHRSAARRTSALTLLLSFFWVAGGCVGEDPEVAPPPVTSPEGGGVERSDASSTDAADDATIDVRKPCEGDRYGFALSNVDPCAIPTAQTTLDLGGVTTIDTSAGTMTGMSADASPATTPLPGSLLWRPASGPELRIVAVTSLSIPAGTTIRVTGTQPLVILVAGNARIEGVALLNGVAEQSGGGARTAEQCADGAGGNAGGSLLDKGSGAGGGGFGASGGSGGAGGGVTGAAGGVVSSSPDLVPLLGGCPGGRAGGTSWRGGAGGALQISAAGDILVSGTISASGGGGPSGIAGAGGGGGSGGAILLEAKGTIAGEGKLTANGGGGASNALESGADGAVAGDTAATGGTCNGCRAGGAGGAKLQANGGPGVNAAVDENGPGGGGSVGRIALRSARFTFSGLMSPPAATRGL